MTEEQNLQTQSFDKAFNLIKMKERILLIVHSNPDGDALGSMLALQEGLGQLGKNCALVCSSPVPQCYRFLPDVDLIKQDFGCLDLVIQVNCKQTVVDKVSYNLHDDILSLVVTPAEGQFQLDDAKPTFGLPNYDLIITLDTPSLKLLGELYERNPQFFHKIPIINIDHHESNQNYGVVNIVKKNAPSTGELIYAMLNQVGIKITAQMATAILTSIITDTGSFQHASTTSQSFSLASELIKQGAKLQMIIDNIYRTKSLSTLKLWGDVLSNLEHNHDQSIVWATVSQESLKESGAKTEDADAVLNDLLSAIPDTQIAIMFYEYPEYIRGSIRTSYDLNASRLAALFGGGGHEPAAGFKLEGKTLAEAKEVVIDLLEKELQARDSQPGEALSPEEIINKLGSLMNGQS
ncbi:MAG TPA: bifunctional oligoribonuclease/PAP phosphatase NrnA [Candidatus Wirthbacteria bacterium]|nr:bifunctional oligoribonuclease/PAP phosphatase NrnA [Candidatus Wirthbacteria bacterium]